MTDLKGYCLICGNGPLHPDGIHSCHEHPVIAHLKGRIAELEERLANRLITNQLAQARMAELEGAIKMQHLKDEGGK